MVWWLLIARLRTLQFLISCSLFATFWSGRSHVTRSDETLPFSLSPLSYIGSDNFLLQHGICSTLRRSFFGAGKRLPWLFTLDAPEKWYSGCSESLLLHLKVIMLLPLTQYSYLHIYRYCNLRTVSGGLRHRQICNLGILGGRVVRAVGR